MEADPATFNEDTLTALAGLGVNRLSVGVQSFSAPLLEAVGRTEAVECVLEVGCREAAESDMARDFPNVCACWPH